MISTAIVLINYFKEEELIQFVKESLLRQLNDERLIVIVNNGSHTSLLTSSFAETKYIKLLEPKTNLGYFGAARFAHEYLDTNQIRVKNFIISNFDLEFKSEDFLNELEKVCSNTDSSVIGPSIKSSLSGAALNPMYKERMTSGKLNRLLFVTSFYPLFLFYQWLHHLKRGASPASNEKQPALNVYAIHGSFIVLKQSYFDAGGNLNFKSFLYGEELFIAEECRRMNIKVLFEPSLRLEHREHTTTGNYKNSKHMKWLHQSLRYIRDEYYVS